VALGFGAIALHAAQNSRRAEREASRANLTSDYLTSVLLQFLPHESNGIPNAALIPLIDASADPDRLAPLGREPLALIRIRNLLATAYLQLDQPKKALDLYEQNLSLAQSVKGNDHPVTLECQFNVAGAAVRNGDGSRAEQLYRDLLATIGKRPGEFLIQRVTIVNNLGALLGESNRRQEALDLYERHYEALEPFAHTTPGVLQYRANYANQLLVLGKTDKAIDILREVLETCERTFGSDHVETLMAKHRLANALTAGNDYPEAEHLLREILPGLSQTLGPKHPATLGNAFKLASLLHHLNRPGEGCAISTEFFGNPADPELVKKGSGPGDLLPPCP
jgi:tetratricopeptide (TPR) repeat protein